MEEVKYIPGDLVMTNGVPLGTTENVIYRVTSSDPSKTLKLDDGTVLKGVVCLENIEGAEYGYWNPTYSGIGGCILIPHGSIKKLIGRELSWSDEPVELK